MVIIQVCNRRHKEVGQVVFDNSTGSYKLRAEEDQEGSCTILVVGE